MSERQIFVLQRLSALVLGPLDIVQLLLNLYDVRDGLTAAEIHGRTQGSVLWAAIYGAFVLAAAIHAPIGLRNVLREWTGLSRRAVDWSMAAFAILLAVLGLRAVLAVVGC
jgi:fumarate reductase subunit C